METSRVGIVRGGLTPAKARTVPNRMVWVNGCGCQRAYSYRYCAADAEMPVAFRSRRPSRPIVLSVSVMTSRIAGYVTRMSGGVGGVLSDGRLHGKHYFLIVRIISNYLIRHNFPPPSVFICFQLFKFGLQHGIDFFRKRHAQRFIKQVTQRTDIRCAQCLIEEGARGKE